MTKKFIISLFLILAIPSIHGSNALLMSAIESNNIEEIQRLIETGAYTKEQHSHDCTATPLQIAVSCNQSEIVKLLLNSGMKPIKSRPSYGYGSALIRAVGNNNLEMVKMLVDAGADVNDTYVYNTRVISHPLENDYTMEYEETALDLAIKKNNPKIIKFLKERGASKSWSCSMM